MFRGKGLCTDLPAVPLNSCRSLALRPHIVSRDSPREAPECISPLLHSRMGFRSPRLQKPPLTTDSTTLLGRTEGDVELCF